MSSGSRPDPTTRGEGLPNAAPGDAAAAEAEPAPRASALAAVTARLRCPQCGAALEFAERQLTCARGHGYDIARQGHVALLPPRRHLPLADSAAMVAAREAFLAAGHYAAIARALVTAARDATASRGTMGGCVVDLGAGTGYYLAAVLDELVGWAGLALDASRPALRRAVRAHPAIAGIACDAWQPLPVQDAVADLVINVFAPRNGPEIARVLSPRGALIVVTPAPSHLHQLSAVPGMLGVAADKQAQLRAKLLPHLSAVARRPLEFDMELGGEDVHALVAMGPSAHHVTPDEVAREVTPEAELVRVTASVLVETFRPV